MLKVDFHVHTAFSADSRITLEQLSALSREKGIIPAITDHNTMEGAEKFRGLSTLFIPGEEVRAVFNGKLTDISGLFLTEEIPAQTDALEALDRIKGQGGLSCLPHMYDFFRYGLGSVELASRVDIIEAFNARSMLGSFNEKAAQLAKKLGKPMAAGSDSHFPYEFGSTWTELDCDELEPEAVLRALHKGAKIAGKRTSFLKRKWVKHFG